MATPVPFKEQTAVLRAPESMPEVLPLPIHRSPHHGFLVSCWELTEQEVEDIVKTRRVFLWIHGPGHPPVSVSSRMT